MQTDVSDKKNWLDIVTACIALMVGAAFWVATPYQIRFEGHAFGVTSRTFPYIAATLVSVCGALLLLKSLRRSGRSDATDQTGFRREELWRLWPYVAVTIVYVLLMPLLGYVSTTVLALAALLLLSGVRPSLIFLAVCILVPAGLYFFFSQVMQVPLPTGFLL